MTVIRPNSISGITSITAQANEINVFRHNGVLAGLQLNGVNHHTSAGVSTFHTLNVLGNLDVAGVLTYQDVTNVDSVGIITARSTIDAQGDISIVDKIIHTGDTNTAIRFPAADTITFETSGALRFGIASDGKVLIDNSTGTLTIGGDNVYDSAKINLMVGNSSQTSATTEATALVIHDQNSRRNGTEGAGSWKSKITFRSTQINGNSQSEGASIVHDITYNNYSSNKMRSDLVFKTRGDAQTSTSDAATEKLRIRHDGKVVIGTNYTGGTLSVAGNIITDDGTNGRVTIQADGTSTNQILSTTTGFASYCNMKYQAADHIFLYGGTERLRITSGGRVLINNLGNATPGLSNNTDDLVIGYGTQSGETGITMYSTSTSGIRFNDNSGTDGAIEYSHSARELRFNSAGNNRLQFGVNASNSPVFSFGTGHYSGDSNNHNQGDRASVKVGAYLHLESALGAGHNTRAGLGYNCYFRSLESFYCGTKSPSGGDNRPAAYGMAYGNHYFYSDASNTAHAAQAQLTMTKNMVIHRQGYVTKPNQPSFLVAPASDAATINGFVTYTTVYHNNGTYYNTSNGRFTAPVTGYYTFFANYVGHSGSNNVFVRFYINGTYNQRGQHYSGTGRATNPYMSCDTTATHTLLQANDYVQLHLTCSGHDRGQHGYMRFCGYLVH